MKIKQLFIGAAVLGLMGMVPSLARAEVTSDVVGYTTMDLEAGKWYLIGTPFADCAGGDIKLNDHLVSGFHAKDLLQLFDPDTLKYTTYLFTTGLGDDGTGSGWCKPNRKTPVDITLAPGVATFINVKTSTTVTFAGKVQISTAFEFGSEEGNTWNQIVSPACADTKLNDLVWSGVEAKDLLQLFDPDTLKYTTYIFTTGLGDDGTGSGWCKPNRKTPVDVVVKVGEAFFINKKSTGIGYVAAQ